MKKFAAIVLLTLACRLLGGVYWISPNATSFGLGTQASPYNSFQAALERHGGGHTYMFMDGDYQGDIKLTAKQVGKPSSPTILRAYNKYGAHLFSVGGACIEIRECPWTVIDGFEISGGTGGVINYSSYVVVKNCWIHNVAGQGIGSFDTNNIIIEANLVEFNGMHPQFHHGIYAYGESITVSRNIVRYNSGFGIHLWPEVSGSIIVNNLIHNNHNAGIILSSKQDAAANKIVNNTVAFNGDGIFIGNSEGDTIANNIVCDNRGFYQNEQISPYQSEPNSFDKLDFMANFCVPGLSKYAKNNYTGKVGFVEPYRSVFFITGSSDSIGKGAKEYSPEIDFFGKKRDEDKLLPGCFNFYPELDKKWQQRKDWYLGWPYYFKGKSGIKPDLWDFDAIVRVN